MTPSLPVRSGSRAPDGGPIGQGVDALERGHAIILPIRFMAGGEDTVVGVQAPAGPAGRWETHFMPPVDTDRNLLFGLLALQNGLIDQAKLVAAFQAWTLEKARPLAQHLVARGRSGPRRSKCCRGARDAAPQEAWRQHRKEPGGHPGRAVNPAELAANCRPGDSCQPGCPGTGD